MTSTRTISKWMTGAALVAALCFAAPHQAQAQVGFGVSVGSYPVQAGYGAYDPYARQQYWEHKRWEAARAAEWRHEQWERSRVYGDRGWDHGWDRGRDFHGRDGWDRR